MGQPRRKGGCPDAPHTQLELAHRSCHWVEKNAIAKLCRSEMCSHFGAPPPQQAHPLQLHAAPAPMLLFQWGQRPPAPPGPSLNASYTRRRRLEPSLPGHAPRGNELHGRRGARPNPLLWRLTSDAHECTQITRPGLPASAACRASHSTKAGRPAARPPCLPRSWQPRWLAAGGHACTKSMLPGPLLAAPAMPTCPPCCSARPSPDEHWNLALLHHGSAPGCCETFSGPGL